MFKQISGARMANAMVGLAVSLVAAGSASAETAGRWQVKAGINHIAPHVTSGTLSDPSPPDAKVDVGSAT